MTVKQGYKLTEVGVIPEDWEVMPLDSLLTSTPRYGINAPATEYLDTLPTYLRITDITEDGRFNHAKKSSVNHDLSDNYFLNDGDIVLARTGASVGKSYAYKLSDGKLVFAGFLIKISPNQSKLSSAFLSYLLQTKNYWNWVTVNSMRSGQAGINGKEYATFPVTTPSITEQTAIANALSNADAYINSLEQLIAKKQQIKQGTMQQLLTGKKRLEGFSGEWEEVRIDDLGYIRSGGTPSTVNPSFWNGAIKWCTPTDITALKGRKYITTTEKNITEIGLKNSSAEIIPAQSLIITSRASIGDIAINLIPMATNQGFKNIVPLSNMNVDFLYYLLSTKKMTFLSYVQVVRFWK